MSTELETQTETTEAPVDAVQTEVVESTRTKAKPMDDETFIKINLQVSASDNPSLDAVVDAVRAVTPEGEPSLSRNTIGQRRSAINAAYKMPDGTKILPDFPRGGAKKKTPETVAETLAAIIAFKAELAGGNDEGEGA